MNNDSNVDKIDVEELLKDYRVFNLEVFISYLRDVWRDLAQRSEEKSKGINKITFSKYYDLPGIISDRLFAVLDRNNNDFLDMNEFIEGMSTLFFDSIDKIEKFVFQLYDFDKDGMISKEDVRVVLSYIPLNVKSKVSSEFKLKFEQEDYKDRVESQDELHRLLEKCFNGMESMNYDTFLSTIEKINSDFFLFILIFLLEKKPFSKKSLQEFNGKKANNQKISNSPATFSRLIASPNLASKFSPSALISKSPAINSKRMSIDSSKPDSQSILNKFAKNKVTDSKNVLSKYAVNKPAPENEVIEEVKETKVDDKNAPVRKNRLLLKNIEELPSNKLNIISTSKSNYSDLPITPAKKQDIKGTTSQINEEFSDDESEDVKFEGILYKITTTKKLKKLWFKLLGKDLYYYKSQEESKHKGMHNLSGVFLQEENQHEIDGIKFYCFSVVYPKKSRYYYVDNELDYTNWLKNIRRAIGYSNLTDIYDVKEKLGNGKFGLVRLGIHKATGRKVAIKIMSKKDMNNQDLELVKTEIEILKICQHPYIIRLYDIFENADFIYISKDNLITVMEFCSGGDLFSYIEKRGFRMPEARAASIVHKLSTAVYYIHSYGIAHRDLKPENILMTDNTEDADIRLLDFGLSKIIGPTETCTEPFGTLSYVAPEILLEKPYTKAVDIWSIGIITFLLVVGYLPFDDEKSEREIARCPSKALFGRKTHPTQNFLSKVAILYNSDLLNKDPSKRMSIKEVLDHSWIQKFTKNKVTDRRTSNDSNSSNFSLYTTINEESKSDKK